MRNLIIKIMQTGGAKIYSVLLGIITLSITARWLGPEGRGIVASVITWVNIFTELAAVSLGSVLIFKATKDRDEKWIPKMLGTLLGHTLIVTLLSWSLIALLYMAGHYWGLPNVLGEIPAIALLVGFIILPLGLWDVYSRDLLNIEDRLGVYNKFQIVGSTANSLSIVVLVVVSGFGVLGVLFSKIIWQSIIAIGGIRDLISHTSTKITYSYETYKDLLKNGLKMHLGTIGAIMTTSIDIIMVNAYLGNEQTGIYQLAVQMSQLMLIVSYSANTVLQGELTRKGVHGVWSYQKKILGLTLAFIIASAIFMGFTAKWWLIVLAGEEFRGAIIIFQLLLITIVVNTITTVMSVQWIGRGWFLLNSGITLFKGVMNIGLNALLIPKYGILGAVYATIAVITFSLCINIAMFIYCELDARRHNKQQAET
ncbi:MAG: oligosaccharide flippase family protein [Thiotrichaceae bacterium]